jgi:hypothetical protein
LQDDAITNVQALYVISYFDNFTDDFVTRVRVAMSGQRGRRDTQVAIKIDLAQVAAAYAREMIANAHPVGCGQRLSWKILHLQGGKRGEIGSAPEAPQKLGNECAPGVKLQG